MESEEFHPELKMIIMILFDIKCKMPASVGLRYGDVHGPGLAPDQNQQK